MLIKRPRRWEIPESEATPEAVFFGRRRFLKGAAAIAAATTALGATQADAASLFGNLFGGDDSAKPAAPEAPDPTADLYPAKRNPAFTLDRAVTPEPVSSTYNNFYEFGTSKGIYRDVGSLRTRPWTVEIAGMVETPRTVGIDDLIRAMPLEERLYRHRCVEAWSMAVPWTGFPLSKLVEYAKPLSGATYVRMETFLDTAMAPGQKAPFYPWPYVEGLTMAEATNDLAFMVTGVYGKPLLKQFGAPLRLAVPWKYGFKSVKSIVRLTFTDKRPETFWESLQSSEYGFWANVNPAVPHPRWSQATEEVIGTGERVATQIYNGYGPEVAGLYKDLGSERLFM